MTRTDSWRDPAHEYLWPIVSAMAVVHDILASDCACMLAITSQRSVRHQLRDRSPGQVLPISPGGSANATCSLSRLASRSFSTRDRFPLILSKFTASTSIAPLDDPRTTFSIPDPCGISTYFAISALRKEVPYDIAEDGRMKDPEFGILCRLRRIGMWDRL